jgi:hypothetical protein
MTPPEALLSLFWGLIQLGAGIGCLYAAWLTHGIIRRERRIEREIQKMWATAKVVGNPLYSGAVLKFAQLLGIELDDTHGDN